LTVHANKTKQKLVVKETLTEPHVYEKLEPAFEAKAFGMKFKKDAKNIQAAIIALDADEMAKFKNGLDTQGLVHVSVSVTALTAKVKLSCHI
jgi:glycyl-tRNA synthetase